MQLYLDTANLNATREAASPFTVLQQAVEHPLTDRGIEQFPADWKARA